MEYQKIINLLHDITNQPSKFRTRNWIEINDELEEKYANSNIRFKMQMRMSNLFNFSHVYILVKSNYSSSKHRS